MRARKELENFQSEDFSNMPMLDFRVLDRADLVHCMGEFKSYASRTAKLFVMNKFVSNQRRSKNLERGSSSTNAFVDEDDEDDENDEDEEEEEEEVHPGVDTEEVAGWKQVLTRLDRMDEKMLIWFDRSRKSTVRLSVWRRSMNHL
ncbi:hypothetical protein M5689_006694 [Euphorbia peplus]|nr:hypothetical protein M5689_006694 [Euphorbia peplus]